MKKINIELTVKKIEVDDEGYYAIDYVVSKNGSKAKTFHYESDYDNQTRNEWFKTLSAGEAVKRALGEYIESL
jgi:hypothetical protein